MSLSPESSQALRELVLARRVAALGTLHGEAPFVSMVPFALLRERGVLLVHVSRLATHTRDMERDPRVSLLITEPEPAGGSVLALGRVTLQAQASCCTSDAADHAAARAAYLERHPASEELFSFGDFSLWRLEPRSIRWVQGFGRAYAVGVDEWLALLAGPGAPTSPQGQAPQER